jgi:hypothetical protein
MVDIFNAKKLPHPLFIIYGKRDDNTRKPKNEEQRKSWREMFEIEPHDIEREQSWETASLTNNYDQRETWKIINDGQNNL